MKRPTEYNNKLFSILGDSISTLDGYSLPDYAAYYTGYKKFQTNVFSVEDTWWGQVIDHLGGQLLVNNSFAGSMVCMPLGCEIESYGCSNLRTSALDNNIDLPDVIMVFMGTNDWGAGKPLLPDQHSTDDIRIFGVAYKVMLEKLIANYPNAEIWCFTLPLNPDAASDLFMLHQNKKRHDIKEYCEIICKTAHEMGCRIIDLNSTVKQFDTVDDFHPTSKGMKTIADGVLEQLTAKGIH